MGYISRVRCIIYCSQDTLEAFLTEQLYICSNPVLKHFKHVLTRYPVSLRDRPEPLHVLDLHTQGKWYGDFEAVDAWETFIEAAEEAGLFYEFVRIGEDPTDIEQRDSEHSEKLLYIGDPPICTDYNAGEPIPLPG